MVLEFDLTNWKIATDLNMILVARLSSYYPSVKQVEWPFTLSIKETSIKTSNTIEA